jgi:hypothetical protein
MKANPSPAEITAFAHELIKRDIEAGIRPFQRLLFGSEATPDTEDYKKRDEEGRVILELRGNTVYETHYNDRPDAKYEKAMSYWKLTDKRTNKQRPDLVAWAESVRKKVEDTDNSQKEGVQNQSD